MVPQRWMHGYPSAARWGYFLLFVFGGVRRGLMECGGVIAPVATCDKFCRALRVAKPVRIAILSYGSVGRGVAYIVLDELA